MYRYIPGEELEHEVKERYRPGGFHPIMPGDQLGYQGRYKVANKLGWGYGSTVWLCKDLDTDSWRAVKVLQADCSDEENTELKIFKLLEHVDREELERNHIGLPETYFWQEGPNGRHLCFVSKLVAAMDLGPPSGYGQHSPTMLVDLCFQLAVAVKYLHDKGICHGDIRMQNIGMRLDDAVERLRHSEMERYIGEPMRYSEVEKISGRPAYPDAPDDMLYSGSLTGLESKYRTGKLILFDFGLSYETAKLPPEQMSYRSNAAPELLFKRSPKGPATDLWALACVFVQLRTPYALVSEFDTWVRLLQAMEWRSGPLPEIYRNDVLTKLKEWDEYSVDEKRETPWKPGDPLSIPMSLETYKKARNDHPNHNTIKGSLDCIQQTHTSQLAESWMPDEFLFYDGTSDEYSSDEGGGLVRPKRRKGPNSLSLQEATKGASNTGPQTSLGATSPASKPTDLGGTLNQLRSMFNSDIPLSEQAMRPDIQRYIDRGRPYKRRNFPDSTSPCICDWDRALRRHVGINESCPAKQHGNGDPDQIVVWQMSESEQRVLGNLLEGIFKHDPKERLTTDQVFKHRWIKQRRESLEM